jgi:hypothetical protein
MEITIFTICLSIAGAILYRMGGSDRFNTKWRDLGCPTCAMGVVWIIDGFHLAFWWAYLVSFLLMFASLTTYWKKKGSDAKWYNWIFVGLGFSASRIPLAIMTHDWKSFAIQAIAVTSGVTIWSQLIKNAVVEELGRGFIFVATTALLFVLRRRRKD